ncbi:MAG: hypothetical protein WC360_04685 [Opitutales bacterium]|jgi:hypothetical protein
MTIRKLPALLPLAALALCIQTHPAYAQSSPQEQSVAQTPALTRARALIARPELAAYKGWLKYLIFRTAFDAEKQGPRSEQALAAEARLEEWTAKIEADPDIIGKLRGVQEWAYESPVDGSGQPFEINIPTDYDPAHPTPISMYAHGYSGNHMEFAAYTPREGFFELSILGRARGGFYAQLSEIDVLDVLDYVRAHWNIDPRRMHINGGSMGGLACYRFGSRYPDIWASARPACGFALNLPVSNMLLLPVYSTHSDDDPVVSIVRDRAPMQRLRDLGGMVISDETTGYGHAVWDYADGNRRGEEWEQHQVRPDPKEVRRVDYTATDGVATGAWWGRITLWGPTQEPARFILNAEQDNSLYIRVVNVGRLRIDIADSPIARDKDLSISVNGAVPVKVSAPLPENIELVCAPEDKAIAALLEKSVHPHSPGGSSLVYDGSPLLIVYGTQGCAEENKAMKNAAISASKSPNCSWPVDDVERAKQDGVSHFENLYGNLNTKADADVSAEDIARCNLVLIGTARQNSLLARMAAELPVGIEGDRIQCSDGESYQSKDNALGLVHYNPLAPERLILWLASEDAAFYRPDAMLPEQMFNHGLGVDLLIMGADKPDISCARSFDNGWNWSSGHAAAALMPSDASTSRGQAKFMAKALRDAARADFGVLPCVELRNGNDARPSIRTKAGVTRKSDIALLYYGNTVYLLDLTGTELLALAEKNIAHSERPLVFSESPEGSKIDPKRHYTVAVLDECISPINQTGGLPQRISWTPVTASEAVMESRE